MHRVGSGTRSNILTVEGGGRLGLSATPQRFGDPDGTKRLFDYFGPVLRPRFGIPEAQAAKRLVPYDYYVYTVDLSEDEETEYLTLTKTLNQLRAREGAGQDVRRRIEMLQIERARIVKKARAKVPMAQEILAKEYEVGQRWLVYCEDTSQLQQVSHSLRSRGIEALEYHSSMVGDPPATLKAFESFGGVLVSIRCLDEGIDIPAVDRALILASATNPREYIQRRGRVLRTAQYKYSADIHDVLVCRSEDGTSVVLNRDLERARTFAVHARNESCRYQLDNLEDDRHETDDQFEEDDEDFEW
jgi:superfamily II DNA or RNA helicase